jgi:hypothetical protein
LAHNVHQFPSNPSPRIENMHLWTEYEGNTLAGYPVGRLVRSEGRSAFFLTNTPDDKPAMLRLTEAHYDEGELVERWKKAASVSHPHLLALKNFGQTTFDGVPLACCLMEPTDASLSDVLRERVLTTDETKEVAEAVAGALAAIHAAGLIHEHIDATNVFAVDEVVKLRSDCMRECTGDFEADTPEAREALRQRDVRDLGLLLLRCLTMDWQGTTSMPLPTPFDRLVPRALDGTWNAEEIVAALNALKPAPLVVRPAAVAVPSPAAVAEPAASAARSKIPVAARASSVPPPVVARVATKPVSDDPFDIGLGSLRNEPRSAGFAKSTGDLILRRLTPMKTRPISRNAWIGASAAAAMLALVLWNTVGGSKSEAKESPAPITEGTPATQKTTPPPAPQGTSTVAAGTTANGLLSTMRAQPGWHVIAYTYNYEQQAQSRAVQLQRKYFALRPQVFTPTGHAPYFVALGNGLDQDSASALRDHARRAGLPRDTYIRAF